MTTTREKGTRSWDRGYSIWGWRVLDLRVLNLRVEGTRSWGRGYSIWGLFLILNRKRDVESSSSTMLVTKICRTPLLSLSDEKRVGGSRELHHTCFRPASSSRYLAASSNRRSAAASVISRSNSRTRISRSCPESGAGSATSGMWP